MKKGILTSSRLWLPLLAVALTVALASWDVKQTPGGRYQQEQNPTDTTPKKKKDKKIRDLDEALEELNGVDMQAELERAQVEIAKALKQLDVEKMRVDMENAMKGVDMEKMKADIEKALKSIDFEKMQLDMKESLAKIDFEKLKVELEEIKKTDFAKMEQEMRQMQVELKEELAKIRPELEKELANVKVEMEKAKVEIEKAKAEIKEYKEFVDGLDKDGLINKKENYTIKHENGVLTINGKRASEQTHTKYKAFLEKHKEFSIKKDGEDFDIDMD